MTTLRIACPHCRGVIPVQVTTGLAPAEVTRSTALQRGLSHLSETERAIFDLLADEEWHDRPLLMRELMLSKTGLSSHLHHLRRKLRGTEWSVESVRFALRLVRAARAGAGRAA